MSHITTRPIVLNPLTESDEQIKCLVNELRSHCQTVDLDLNEQDAELCVRHLLLVNQVNSYMNLTRIQNIHEALVLHVVDSLLLARDLPCSPDRFLDFGTGAGFPGIPFSIITGSSGILLDSVGKKINAVNAFIDQLGLKGIKGVHDRCESYAINHSCEFDLVFARAVGQMNLILEYATPFLEEDGYVLVAKAYPSDDEITLAIKTADICSLELVDQKSFELPNSFGHRSVFLFQKIGDPKVVLPRAIGLAKKYPLVS